ncbi:flavin reductase family protein [Shimia biformata]|uniref:flavin reductase family protein n=1 Tax=Shimia biformata TaxID=1294299 RepID=UPI00194F242D|nr:flavin reductase family protein [Shimia biformata]
MFGDQADPANPPHNPFNALVTPRPIAWVSTVDGQGVRNLAPYSFFNATAYVPPQVMFASTSAKPDQDGTKDSVANIRETGVFCINVVEQSARDAMNISSGAYDKDVDEFARAGLSVAECQTITCPRIADAPASLECKLTQIVQLPGEANFVVHGEVTGVHIRPDTLRDGRFDVTTFQPLSRLGYRDYAVVENVFTLTRPDD